MGHRAHLQRNLFQHRFPQSDRGPRFSPNILGDPVFASLVTRNPTAEQLDSACSQGRYLYLLGTAATCRQSAVAAILDLLPRTRKASAPKVSISMPPTIDVGAGDLETAPGRHLPVSFYPAGGARRTASAATRHSEQSINLKMRGTLSWQHRRWGATVGINFQNHYMDTVSEPNRTVSSYTTFDTQLRYELAPSARISSKIRVSN